MKRTHKRQAAGLLAAACALGLALPAAAAPQVDPNKAVIDNAGILSNETEEIVTNLSAALSDTCGAQIGVYTVDQVGNNTIEGYAYEVFDAWGLGDADRDNGVLLLLAPGDDNYWAMQGAGLETRLPSTMLGDILNDKLEPSWVARNYDTGTQATVRALAEELCTIYGVSMDIDAIAYGDFSSIGGENQKKGGVPVFGILVLILMVVVVVGLIAVVPRFGRPRAPRPPRPRHRFFFGAPRPPRPPRPPRGPRGFGGPRPPRSSRPHRSSHPPRGGRPGGGSRPHSFRAGGGSTRGGGAGRRH